MPPEDGKNSKPSTSEKGVSPAVLSALGVISTDSPPEKPEKSSIESVLSKAARGVPH